MRLPYIALSYAAGFSPKITARNFVLATVLSNALSATILVIIGVAAVVYFAFATAVLIGAGAVYVVWKRYHLAR
jgi:membrane protein DedA with SNARE-associated domain